MCVPCNIRTYVRICVHGNLCIKKLKGSSIEQLFFSSMRACTHAVARAPETETVGLCVRARARLCARVLNTVSVQGLSHKDPIKWSRGDTHTNAESASSRRGLSRSGLSWGGKRRSVMPSCPLLPRSKSSSPGVCCFCPLIALGLLNSRPFCQKAIQDSQCQVIVNSHFVPAASSLRMRLSWPDFATQNCDGFAKCRQL